MTTRPSDGVKRFSQNGHRFMIVNGYVISDGEQEEMVTCPNCKLVWTWSAQYDADYTCRCGWVYETDWKTESSFVALTIAAALAWKDEDVDLYWNEVQARIEKLPAVIQRTIAEDFGMKFSFDSAKRTYEIWISSELKANQ